MCITANQAKIKIKNSNTTIAYEHKHLESLSISDSTFSDTKQRCCSDRANPGKKSRGSRPRNQKGLQVVRYREDETMMASYQNPSEAVTTS